MTELHPELEKALREWRSLYPNVTTFIEGGHQRALLDAIDRHLPEPDFAQQVLAHLPAGWKVAENGDWPYDDEGKRAEYRWAFRPPHREDWYNSLCVIESSHPKAVADALLLLAGEA